MHSPFFVFETPTLSTHAKDFGDDFGDGNTATISTDANSYHRWCSSLGGNHGGGGGSGSSDSYTRARSSRRSARGVRHSRSNNNNGDHDDGSPPACYREHYRQRSARSRSASPGRRPRPRPQAAAATGKAQAKRAASLLYSSLRFAAAVKSETLPPGEWHGSAVRQTSERDSFSSRGARGVGGG